MSDTMGFLLAMYVIGAALAFIYAVIEVLEAADRYRRSSTPAQRQHRARRLLLTLPAPLLLPPLWLLAVVAWCIRALVGVTHVAYGKEMRD